ncbi:MAG: M2 family metallopeptidase, partial [Actinobacteria bacterium]|nr:M2 family metallopeptidase [Actinomycetota bacterium]
MNKLESATREPFRELKAGLDADLKRRFEIEKVLPWHLSDPFFQESSERGDLDVDHYFEGKDIEALTRRTYDSLGFEVRDVIARSDLHERAGKDQHAFCLRVGREYPYDVRVLANVRDDAYWMNTMLHEFGHAVYDKYINPSLPYLLRTVAHINSTETIALMMGALADDPGWLSSVAGISEEELDLEKLTGRRRADGLVFTRWALVMYRFEKALYDNPDRDDLNGLWWDLVEEIQFVRRPPDRDEPDWAAKLHVALAPVYYHNYVLGNLAAQLRSHLEKNVAGNPFYGSEIAGRYLQEAFFGPGARDDWRTTVLRATGEPLDPAYFVEA